MIANIARISNRARLNSGDIGNHGNTGNLSDCSYIMSQARQNSFISSGLPREMRA